MQTPLRYQNIFPKKGRDMTQFQETTLEMVQKEYVLLLEAKKRQVHREIVNYPPPIPACDVQFNHLLDERGKLTQELSRIRALGSNLSPSESLIVLAEAIRSSSCLDRAAKAKLVLKLAQIP